MPVARRASPTTLVLALCGSFALHAALLLTDFSALRPPSLPPMLSATLRLPPEAVSKKPPEPDEPLLKNTLDAERPASVEKRSPPPEKQAVKPATPTARTTRREVQTAQKKLSEHLFYPSEAVARGWEGEVRLILKLAADGSVEDASVAGSSGHPILDSAAIRAAYAMGRQPGMGGRELIVPVIFRLQ